jgi:hypothetical protein
MAVYGHPSNAAYPPWAPQFGGDANTKPQKYWADLTDNHNCIFTNTYEEWMMGVGFSTYYLFNDGRDCCEMWFPSSNNCPDEQAQFSDTFAVTEDNPNENYFFPDFDEQSCGHGRNYPAWMGQEGYSQWYLFFDPSECCNIYFPQASNCPYEVNPQIGYYWEVYQPNKANDATDIMPYYNHSFYPSIMSGTCVNGTDYPAWMIETEEYKHLYIFHEAQDCCEFWFADYGVDSGCVSNVIQSVYESETTINPNATAAMLEMWYPVMEQRRCIKDGNTPRWMLSETFREYYLYNTQEACCSMFC